MWGSTAAALPSLVCCPWHSELSPVASLWGGVLGTSVRSYSSSFAIARQHLQGPTSLFEMAVFCPVEPFDTAPNLSTL